METFDYINSAQCLTARALYFSYQEQTSVTDPREFADTWVLKNLLASPNTWSDKVIEYFLDAVNNKGE